MKGLVMLIREDGESSSRRKSSGVAARPLSEASYDYGSDWDPAACAVGHCMKPWACGVSEMSEGPART